MVVLIGLLSVSCSETMWKRRSPDFQQVPVYPHARNAHLGAWQRCTRKGCFGEERRLSFITGDAEAKVLAYYDQVLATEGWTKTVSTDKLPAYMYQHGCPFYVITFAATVLPDSSMHVEAILSREGCR